jgi:hypothetical protein
MRYLFGLPYGITMPLLLASLGLGLLSPKSVPAYFSGLLFGIGITIAFSYKHYHNIQKH